MDEFLTDDEQAERTKQWLRENSVFVVAGVVLGLGSLFGWQQWQDYQDNRAGQAAVVWEQMRGAIEGKRFNEVNESMAILEADYAATPYVDQAHLALAKMHMERSEPDAALEQLEQLARVGSDPQLRRIAELRMAQVLLFLERYDEAIDVLGSSDNSAFAGQYHELRGDISFAQGDLAGAEQEYLLALQAAGSDSVGRSYVQMKIDDVAGSLAAAAPPEAAPADTASGADEVVTPTSQPSADPDAES